MRNGAMALLLCVFTAMPAWAGERVDVGGEPDSHASSLPASPSPGATWKQPAAAVILYDNGPLITGPCGADFESLRQSTSKPPLTAFGFNHAVVSNARVADDFTIPEATCWNIANITFFAYQTGSDLNSTITQVNYQIWSGRPGDAGSVVLFGDTSTNRIISTAWSQIFRSDAAKPCINNRPIMADVCSAGIRLDAGTYWLDWQTDGTLGLGPFAPPITILGQSATGNARHFFNDEWLDMIDSGSGTPQGLPFIIEGAACLPTPVEARTWGSIKAFYR